jgi:hypothetical protein
VPPVIVAVTVAGAPGHDGPPPLICTVTGDETLMVALPLLVPLQRESVTEVIAYVVVAAGARSRQNDEATVSVTPSAQVML